MRWTGWVQLLVIDKGVERVDPLPIELPQASSIGRNTTSTTAQPPQDVLHAALRDLWRSIKQDEATLTQVLMGMSERSKTIFFHRRSGEYAEWVNRCKLQFSF